MPHTENRRAALGRRARPAEEIDTEAVEPSGDLADRAAEGERREGDIFEPLMDAADQLEAVADLIPPDKGAEVQDIVRRLRELAQVGDEAPLQEAPLEGGGGATLEEALGDIGEIA